MAVIHRRVNDVNPTFQSFRHRFTIKGVAGGCRLTQIGPDADGGEPEALKLAEMAGELRLEPVAIPVRPHGCGITWHQHVLESPGNPASL